MKVFSNPDKNAGFAYGAVFVTWVMIALYIITEALGIL